MGSLGRRSSSLLIRRTSSLSSSVQIEGRRQLASLQELQAKAYAVWLASGVQAPKAEPAEQRRIRQQSLAEESKGRWMVLAQA